MLIKGGVGTRLPLLSRHDGGHFATCGTTVSCLYGAAVYPVGGLYGAFYKPCGCPVSRPLCTVSNFPVQILCKPCSRPSRALYTGHLTPRAARCCAIVHHQQSVCVCVFFPFILDIKFVGRTSRGHTGGRSHRIQSVKVYIYTCTTGIFTVDPKLLFLYGSIARLSYVVYYYYPLDLCPFFPFFSFFNLTYSRWISSLPSCLWSQRIFPSLPGSRLTIFYRDASSALLQLVNQWLNFSYSRSHAFLYERKNTNPTLVRIELTTSALAGAQVTY